jgi:hypothetical protein
MIGFSPRPSFGLWFICFSAIDAADRSALTRSQLAALARARTLLAGKFDVSVEYSKAPSDEDEAEAKPGAPSGAAAAA